MREALTALLQRLRGARGARWHAWQEIDTARAMPVAAVLEAIADCPQVAAAGTHAAAFERYAGRASAMQVLPADEPLALDAKLQAVDALVITDARWTALLLRDAGLLKSVALKVRRTFVAPLCIAAEPVRARWGGGFHAPSDSSGRHYWRWCGNARGRSEVVLFYDAERPCPGTLGFSVRWPASGAQGAVEVVVDGGARRVRVDSARRVELPLALAPGANRIAFESDRAPAKAHDGRMLSFAVADLGWRADDGSASLAPAAAHGLAPLGAGDRVRLSAAEHELHAAGFWTVKSIDGARSSTGVYQPVVSGAALGASAGIVWLLAERG